jgi:hypothetical protein
MHALQAAHVSSKSVSNEGHLLLLPKDFFIPIATAIACWGPKRHNGTPAYAVQAAHIWSKSVRNEGHFTLMAQRVFRPHLDYHCMRAVQTSYMALPAHALQATQV